MFRIAALLLAIILAGCASARRAWLRYEFTEPQMGVPFRIVLYAPDAPAAEAAADAAFQRIAELNAIMSDYETDSELSQLSRSSEEGSPAVKLSDDLWTVLSAAQQLAHESRGAFDVTIGPCVGLWRKARREKALPDPVRLENARAKAGYQNLILDSQPQTARLLKFGMRLDLGAIAKGYAADQALNILRQRGLPAALVAASGDLAIGAAPPGTRGWRVEIAGLEKPLLLANCGVATSGDLFQSLEINGLRYSHILNPFTCLGLTNQALATVIARDCMSADQLATTLTILTFDEGMALAGKYNAAAHLAWREHGRPVRRENLQFRRIQKNR